jgi:hypothetical protein
MNFSQIRWILCLLLLLVGIQATPARADWSRCASEGDECSMSNNGHHLIRYGADDKFFMLESDGLSHIACNGAVFGDPANGKGKFCDYTDLPDQNTWVDCAGENQNCQLPDAQPRNVRYGTANGWIYKVGSSSIRCSNDEFPDIANGTAKRCQYSKQTIFPAVSGQTSAKFKDCSTEDTVCNIAGSDSNNVLIRFGTGNSWEYRQAVLPSVACNLDTFRVDVATGQKKFCQYVFPPPQITSVIGGWKLVGSNKGGPVNVEVTVGVSNEHTTSHEKTWGLEVEVAIEQEFKYPGGSTKGSVSVKNSNSVADLMSDALTRSVSTTKGASCHEDKKVEMYQWTMDVDEACYIRDGGCKSTVSAFNILCAYNQPNDYKPICPPTMCGDEMCTVCTGQPAAAKPGGN